MTTAEEKAKAIISKLSKESLLQQWELTTNINDPYIPTVRGWLMDEIEKRYPVGFEKWLDGEALDEELRNYI